MVLPSCARGCGDDGGTPAGPLAPVELFIEGPLTLEILAPDSTITEQVFFPNLTYSYVCTLSLQAKLSGGERSSAIVWQTAEIEWH